jgi:hypothetical protein
MAVVVLVGFPQAGRGGLLLLISDYYQLGGRQKGQAISKLGGKALL